MYLTAGRISEVLRIKRKMFYFDTNDSNYTIENMVNLKNKKIPMKNIHIPKRDRFAPMLRQFIEEYYDNGDDYLFFHVGKQNGKPFIASKDIYRNYVNEGNRLLYKKGELSIRRDLPMTRQTGWKIVKKYCGLDFFSHAFRHYRISHWSQRMTDRQVIAMSGHSNSNQLGVYARLNRQSFDGDLIPVD